MDPKRLPGSLKVAILVQSLSKDASQKIFSGLNESDRQVINDHLEKLGPVSPELIESVACEFAQRLKQSGVHRQGRQTGGEASPLVPNQETESAACECFKALVSLEPEQLYNLIKDEHPQTLAVVLVHLDPEIASKVVSKLPDDIKAEVSVRIANLDKVSPGTVEEIGSAFEEILNNKDASVTRVAGGIEKLAEILNHADENSSEYILNDIEENNPDLAAKIKQKMFVFEDLILVDDRGFQKLLRRLETAELAVALKATSDEVAEKVYRNMSSRAVEMLQEEIESMGPVRMTDVAEAQQKITEVVLVMDSEGELMIAGRGGEEFVA